MLYKERQIGKSKNKREIRETKLFPALREQQTTYRIGFLIYGKKSKYNIPKLNPENRQILRNVEKAKEYELNHETEEFESFTNVNLDKSNRGQVIKNVQMDTFYNLERRGLVTYGLYVDADFSLGCDIYVQEFSIIDITNNILGNFLIKLILYVAVKPPRDEVAWLFQTG